MVSAAGMKHNRKWLSKVVFTSPEGCLTDRGLGASTSSGMFVGFLAQRYRFPPLAPHRLRTTELQSFPDVT